MKQLNHTNQSDRSKKKIDQQEQQTHDPKDGIQGERALNTNAKQKDNQLHKAKKNDSHDPKDGIQGESNVNSQQNKK